MRIKLNLMELCIFSMCEILTKELAEAKYLENTIELIRSIDIHYKYSHIRKIHNFYFNMISDVNQQNLT